MGANETVDIFFILQVVIYIICFFVGIWALFKFIKYSSKKMNPNKKVLNKKMLKSYLKNKYGRGYKSAYNQVVREIWEKYKIK